MHFINKVKNQIFNRKEQSSDVEIYEGQVVKFLNCEADIIKIMPINNSILLRLKTKMIELKENTNGQN